MRTALCLSGHMRVYEAALSSQFESLILPNNCDIFIATWNTVGHVGTAAQPFQGYSDLLDVEKLRANYGPRLKDLAVFDFERIPKVLQTGFYHGNINMWWMIKMANELKRRYEIREKFRYECVIRGRPDIRYHQEIKIDDLSECRGTILVQSADAIGVSDILAIGNSDDIDLYSETYSYLPQYSTESFERINGSPNPTPEQQLSRHLHTMGLRTVQIPVSFELLRTDGTSVLVGDPG